jgi:hypothetical protein
MRGRRGRKGLRGDSMTDALDSLLEAARKAETTPEQREKQRRSFAFGNTALENKLITRDMVDRQADKLAREAGERVTSASAATSTSPLI